MLIGLTYDLKQEYLDAGYSVEEAAEFDRIDTIEAIEFVLHQLGHVTDRIGRISSLVDRLASGDRWDLVFNITEGLRGVGREAQVPALLDAYDIPYTFSDPLVCALTLHKAMAKRVVRDLGLPTADFFVVENEAALESMVQASGLPNGAGERAPCNLCFPLFAKPVAEGTSKGITNASKIETWSQLAQTCRRLLAQFQQPVLVEAYLPGREFTVGITGTGEAAQVVGVMEVLLASSAGASDYTRDVKDDWEGRVSYRLVDGPIAREASELALAVWRGLGCRDGGRIDVRADAAGRLNFIEVNPLPGINPVHSDLPIMAGLAGMRYRELIARIVASAMTRVRSGTVAALATAGA